MNGILILMINDIKEQARSPHLMKVLYEKSIKRKTLNIITDIYDATAAAFYR
jgi:hypothetical protein